MFASVMPLMATTGADSAAQVAASAVQATGVTSSGFVRLGKTGP